MTTSKKVLKSLNRTIEKCVRNFTPPENITVTQWAEKNRILSRETSAESGPWRTERTPYLKDIMDAFTDPKINHLTVVAASQVGKSEVELNIIGYIVDQDPGSIIYIQPTLDDAKKFSRIRIAPMIRDSPILRSKVADVKSRDSGNTILQKSFPGGMLTITGSNSASALASTPCRYVIGDELDRWADSAGDEGDPWALAEARQTTFYNRKAIEVSTPTIKGTSKIEDAFYGGTQEHWCCQCPHCKEWHELVFENIHFEHIAKEKNGKKSFSITKITWGCPSCACICTEGEMKKQPAKWIADNPEAYQSGRRSFWLSAFVSAWTSWEKIAQKFLEAGNDPLKLQVVYNTLFGKLWEDRGEMEDEEGMLKRRERYEAELPEGVLVLTCGVDTQDNRLEYEVVGHGRHKETWGIKKGIIMGDPDTNEPWERLDDAIDHIYRFKDDVGLKISATFVDSGGHKTQSVYKQCRKRIGKKVFAIKGQGGDGVPYVNLPKKVPIKDSKKISCWLYSLGVDSGKQKIMAALKVQDPGRSYCHFPIGDDYDRGYDFDYFNGLLSEKMVPTKTRTGISWRWEKLDGHNRNEALDCRNYAIAAFEMMDPDMEAMEIRIRGVKNPREYHKRQETQKPDHGTRSSREPEYYDDW